MFVHVTNRVIEKLEAGKAATVVPRQGISDVNSHDDVHRNFPFIHFGGFARTPRDPTSAAGVGGDSLVYYDS